MGSSRTILDIFTRLSHHASLSIIYTSQNLFHQSSFGLTMRRNISDLVLFYQKTDLQSTRNISKLGDCLCSISISLARSSLACSLADLVVKCIVQKVETNVVPLKFATSAQSCAKLVYKNQPGESQFSQQPSRDSKDGPLQPPWDSS